jgi:hypothetical protein
MAGADPSDTSDTSKRRPLRQAQRGELLGDVMAHATRRARAGQRRTSQPKAALAIAPLAARTAAGVAEGTLDGGERLRVIETFLTVLRGAYCHLPQKRAAYAVDPVQALQLLERRASALSDAEFHLAMTAIVTGLRDAHTRYSGPTSMQNSVAVLPFLVEQYGPYDRPTFLVSKVSAPGLIPDDAFGPNVVLESWSGVPIARAVELYADRETGGRPDARRARALESLTFRDLEFGPPPDERWVDVGFRTARGARREVRIPWRVVHPDRAPTGMSPGSRSARFVAVDPGAERVRRAKKLLFSGAAWAAEARARPRAITTASGADWIPTAFQDVLAARAVTVRGVGRLGYLRVWSFDVDDDDAFIAEVIRLLALLPDRGVILDLRANPGGLIWAAERMLQLFTSSTIVPARFSLVASPLTREMARSPFNRLELEAWAPSLEVTVATGDAYSQPLPLTDPAWCNDVGRRYDGPVVCVVDPNTYSSGDLFAAGFVDNALGTLVSVGEATGAGGANVWTDVDLREALADTPFSLDALPDGVRYTVAIRRAVRSGASDGLPIEDLGVPGVPYAMTRDDLLRDNRDLIAFCARQLERTG